LVVLGFGFSPYFFSRYATAIFKRGTLRKISCFRRCSFGNQLVQFARRSSELLGTLETQKDVRIATHIHHGGNGRADTDN